MFPFRCCCIPATNDGVSWVPLRTYENNSVPTGTHTHSATSEGLSTITGQTHAKCTRRAQAPNGIQTESAPEWDPRWERPGSIPFRMQNSIHFGSCLVSNKESISDSASDPKLNPFRGPSRVQIRARAGFHFQSINGPQNESVLETKMDPGINPFWFTK